MLRTIKDFLLLQLFNLTLCIFLSVIVNDGYLLILFGLATSIIYFLAIKKNIMNGWSPILFYLLGSFIRLGLTTIYMGSVILHKLPLYFGRIELSKYVLNGTFLLALFDMAFIFGFFLFTKGSYLSNNFSDRSNNQWRGGLFLFLFSAAVFFAEMSGLNLNVLGQFLNVFKQFGMSAGTYLMLKNTNHTASYNRTKRLVSLLFVSGHIMVSLFSYMKADVFLALFPIVLIYFEKIILTKARYKIWTYARVILIGYVFVGLLTVYSQVRRKSFEYNLNGSLTKSEFAVGAIPYLKVALSSLVPGSTGFKKYHKYPKGGIWGLINRLSVGSVAGWVIVEVENNGLKESNFFRDVGSILIPRIFWPGKPNIWPGRELSVKLGLASSVKSASTSTGLTMAGSYYWYFGILGVFGMLISGGVLSILWNNIQNCWHHLALACVVAFALFFQNLHWNEGDFYGMLPTYIFFLLLYIPLIRINWSKILK